MESWSLEEDEKLVNLINIYSTNWKFIKQYFSTRTCSSIRNRWIRINNNPNYYLQEDIKKYYRCSKCGKLRRGHICGSNIFSSDILKIKKKKNDIPRISDSRISDTIFKELDDVDGNDDFVPPIPSASVLS